MMSVTKLSEPVMRLIGSTPVVISVSSVVKELVENSIDANATVIDIKLERNGLDKIEVRDNGFGIDEKSATKVCLPHYTSKLKDLSDLEKITSYGFRGEALHCICAVSNISITTKTATSDVAYIYFYDKSGTVIRSEISHQIKGTVVSITGLFKNVPVRKQYYNNVKKATEDLRRVEQVLKLFGVIHPKIRFTLAHNKCLIWQKPLTYSLRQSLLYVYPQSTVKALDDFCHFSNDITVEMLLPKTDCYIPHLCIPSVTDAVMFFVNKRPVKDRKLEMLVMEEMSHFYASTIPQNKCPICVISLTIPTRNVDVNVEPNKTKVFIKDHDDVLKCIREAMSIHFYRQSVFSKPDDNFRTEDNVVHSENLKITNSHEPDSNSISVQLAEIFKGSKSLKDTTQALTSTENFEKSNQKSSGIGNQNDFRILNDCKKTPTKKKSLMSANRENDVDNSNNTEFFDLEKCIAGKKSSASKKKSESFPILSKYVSTIGNSKLKKELDKISNMATKNAEQNKIIRNNKEFVYEENSSISVMENFLTSDFVNKDTFLNTSDVDEDFENIDKLNNREDLFEKSMTNDSIVVQNFQNNELNFSTSVKEKISTHQTTLSQWSKGHVILNDRALQGGVTLGQKRNIVSNFEFANKKHAAASPESSSVLESPCRSNNQSISSQKANKELSGFAKFANEMRSDIIKNAPGISFVQVSNELTKKWRSLHEDEKNLYLPKSKIVKHKTNNNSPAPLLKNNNNPCGLNRKKMFISASVSHIKQGISDSRILSSNFNRADKVHLVNNRNSEFGWLYQKSNEIGIVEISNLQDIVLLFKNLSNMSLPVYNLDIPVTILKSDVGDRMWDLLINLERKNSEIVNVYTINDSRLLKNGYCLEIFRTEQGADEEICIRKIWKSYLGYEIQDLNEILYLMERHKDVMNCRTFKAKYFIKEETKKQCEQKIPLSNFEEIRSLIEYWEDNIASSRNDAFTVQKNILFRPLHKLL